MEHDVSGYQDRQGFLVQIKVPNFFSGQLLRGDWIIETWLNLHFWSDTFESDILSFIFAVTVYTVY